ncbi:MAG TPA: inositol monophosphatase family protein [Spirochaetota bacterium]|nr:inositol monophosphatase family protein [Spirochaetota bacterium]HPJ38020.1 inositol monophosphatase family protein [Spirochaetota bacterium]HPQ52894.1 inositol monophosphatase family protein [Spirochaetota bacterium]
MKDTIENTDFDFFRNVLTEAGAIALTLQHSNISVTRKSDSTIVTQADVEVQNYILKAVRSRFSGFNYIHEENFETTHNAIDDSTLSVIIDPIDGTAVYTMGLPTWSISLGIFRGYTPLYGFVYSPGCNMFFHNDDTHAYLNNTPITVDPHMEIERETNLFLTPNVIKNRRISFPGKLRNLGSTALHCSLVANNRANRTLAYIGLAYLWDLAGAIPVLLKAGGHMRYANGNHVDIRGIVDNGYLLPDNIILYSIDSFEIFSTILK